MINIEKIVEELESDYEDEKQKNNLTSRKKGTLTMGALATFSYGIAIPISMLLPDSPSELKNNTIIEYLKLFPS